MENSNKSKTVRTSKVDSDEEDTDVRLEEKKRRWNVTELANPTVNLTTSSYRKRVFKDFRPWPKRRFLSGLFPEKLDNQSEMSYSSTSPAENESELMRQDQAALNRRICEINEKFDALKELTQSMFNMYLKTLDSNSSSAFTQQFNFGDDR